MSLVNPHGKEKKLKPLLLSGAALEEEKKRAAKLKKINIASRESGDLIMMGIGGFTPLEGFMTYEDWKDVCTEYKMADGTFWPMPVTISTDESVKVGDEIALYSDEYGEIMATMKVGEVYKIDKESERKNVFKTADVEHPR